jgi:hypothetical protein
MINNDNNNNHKKGLNNFKVVFTKVSKPNNNKPIDRNDNNRNDNKRRDEKVYNNNNNNNRRQRNDNPNINKNPSIIKNFQKKSQVQRNIIPYKLNNLERKTCLKCSKVISDMSCAIKDKNEEKYYHFDCIVRDIRKLNLLKQTERCAYLGSGIFGIIEDVKDNGQLKFVIKKRLDLNNKPIV